MGVKQTAWLMLLTVLVDFASIVSISFSFPTRSWLRSGLLQRWWSPSPNPRKRRRRRTPMNPQSLCQPMPCSSETLRQPLRDRIPTPPLEMYPRSWPPCGMDWGRSRNRYVKETYAKTLKNLHLCTCSKMYSNNCLSSYCDSGVKASCPVIYVQLIQRHTGNIKYRQSQRNHKWVKAKHFNMYKWNKRF